MPPLDIPSVLVHCIFFVSLTTTAGLVAVWSALSPRHRLLRLAGFSALPAALWFAPAHDLAENALLLMTAIASSILAVRFIAQAPYGRTRAKLPKLRFGLGDLFFMTFVAGLVVATISVLAPRHTRWGSADMLAWLLETLAPAAAIAAAALLVFGNGHRAWRFAAVLAGILAATAAWFWLIVASDHTIFVLFEVGLFAATAGIDPRFMACVPGVAGVLAAAVLSVMRRGRLVFSAAALAALAAPLCYIYYELARPIRLPEAGPGLQARYDQLVALGKQLAVPGLSAERRDELLSDARERLAVPCSVRIDALDISQNGALRTIWYRLSEAADAERKAGHLNQAFALYLDGLRLAERTQQGGIATDALCAHAYESGSLKHLTTLAPQLSAEQCRVAIAQCLALDAGRDPPDEIAAREDASWRLSVEWMGRWEATVATVSGRAKERRERQIDLPRRRAEAQLRVRACDLAIRAFVLETKRLPESLDDLVPDFLPSVPIDPFDGHTIRFAREPEGYSVSTLEGGAPDGPFVIARQASEVGI